MPDINTQINTLAGHIQQVRDSRSVLGVDRSGELIRLNFKGKVARALVNLGIAREGKLGSRVAIALAGKENFKLLCQSSDARFKNSIANIGRLVKQLETQGLDEDLSKLVESKIRNTLSISGTRITGDSFKELHTLIQNQIIPQRRFYRADLAERIQLKQATPAMEGATYRGIATAVAALENDMEKSAVPYQPQELLTKRHSSGIRYASSKTGPMAPIDPGFTEEVCGLKHDSTKIKRDTWDANKILGELKSAELDVRHDATSEIEDLQSQYNVLQDNIVNQGSKVHPNQLAEWELTSHTLKSQIADIGQKAEKEIAQLKENLLATLKESFKEKEAESKLTETEVGSEIKATQSDDSAKPLKSSLKQRPAADATIHSDSEVKSKPRKRGIHFGGVKVLDIQKSYMDTGYTVNDENRGEWVQALQAVLDDSKDTQGHYAVAKALTQRGRHGKDDIETMKAISLLRTHPVFLEKDNFQSLILSLHSVVEEERKFPDKFPAEVKQNYRQKADAFRELAQTQLNSTKDLLKHLEDYKAGLKKLDSDPEKRKAQLEELTAQLDKYKDYFESYKEVFDDPDINFRVTENIGGTAKTAIDETLYRTRRLMYDTERVLSDLGRSRVFIDK